MILNEKYYRAVDYAYNICSPFATDIVHDSFVAWFDKTQNNLFDESEAVVMKEVKKTYHKKYKGKFASNHSFAGKQILTLDTPETEYIAREAGVEFLTYRDIEAQMNNYEKYHTMYPKIYLN